ncbi:MAG: hypothetical protein Q4D30_00110 [Bacteroidales bacterium]|nr:hypothetical protein [Bacteroidaceae bacterium]MDO4184880.1 hypothetical protein [Bacteroidales bacterium]MBQ9883238.1 hypothetical protein [Bacteroidaceae bacterium]MBR1940216.1 hypothetical protein [Bacteroidaceae bacterium]MBR3013398.1 hypothetical protein [Bacteroidaceae bacterium]
MRRPKHDLSPKTYQVLLVLNVIVAVCCLVIGGFDLYFHEWTPAACMFIIMVFAIYNCYTFKDRIK